MATDNCPRKHSRPDVQFQKEFHLEDNGSKQEFQDRVESRKRKLAPRKALDN